MKKTIAIVLLSVLVVLLIGLRLFSGIFCSPKKFSYEKVEQEVKQRLDFQVEGIKKKDIDLTMKVFAPEVIGVGRTSVDRSYQDIKDSILSDFSSENLYYEYTYKIRELLVEGNIAIARVIWTLKTTDTESNEVIQMREEVSMDIFKYVDNQWLVTRFIVYDPIVRPNAI